MIDIESITNQIINADCMDILKQLPDKCIDLVLTDPPYGIGIDGQKECFCTNPKHNRKLHTQKDWDKEIPKQEIFKHINRIAKNIIICGANYFNEYLKQGKKGWIIWDKGQRGLTMSDCEIFYSNFDRPTRIYTVNRCELIKDFTFHPTQKPLKLFEMILRDYSNENDLILDCFSGSGTTAVACHNLKRRFICIEKDYDYWKASVERLQNAQAQMKLF